MLLLTYCILYGLSVTSITKGVLFLHICWLKLKFQSHFRCLFFVFVFLLSTSHKVTDIITDLLQD